jgi:hypothetical protein
MGSPAATDGHCCDLPGSWGLDPWAPAPDALAQQPVRPLPKMGGCPLGWCSSGDYCIQCR